MLSVLVVAILSVPALLALLWLVEVLAGSLALHRSSVAARAATAPPSHRTAVLIPAHNEGRGLVPTIRDVQGQIGPRDRILVVADNCTDDTAAVAHACGADVIVRDEPARRGKGYALEFGVRHLARDAPDVVVIIDADCRLAANALRILSDTAQATGRPAQALYFMLAPEPATRGQRASVFAWRVKNWIRPLGLKALGLPTHLFGTGMAFPLRLLSNRDLGNSRLAEDTALGLSLAAAGHAPIFASDAQVYSSFPASQSGSEQQRQRWEKGHLDNIVELVPKAIVRSVRDRNLPLAALAIDMAVPPLSLLVLITVACGIVGAAAVALGAHAAAILPAMASAACVILGTAIAWRAAGRDVLPFGDLLRLPLHVLRKLGTYGRIVSGKAASTWIRTDRT